MADRLTFEPDGETFDELVVSGCDIHIERMDDDCIWLGITKDGSGVFHGNIVWHRTKGVQVIINEETISDDV